MGFHSTNFPSEWGADGCDQLRRRASRFHSTNFPSEWGVKPAIRPSNFYWVSIQLISPASGELCGGSGSKIQYYRVSIQLISLASGELKLHAEMRVI